MIPNLFIKQEIPQNLPGILEEFLIIHSRITDREEYLEKAFIFVATRWKGWKINLIAQFPRVFEKDLQKIVNTNGYLHCTTMNYLLRVLLIKSEKFTEEEIQPRLTTGWRLTPHQYLEIHTSPEKKITLDPWAYQYGIDFGRYASGFNNMRIKPIR